jgi:hypothetical protein
LSIAQWALLLGSQLVVGLVTVYNFNPINAGVAPDKIWNSIVLDKLLLIWWNFRDMNDCEFCVGILILAAPLMYFWTRNVWFLRGAVAVVFYTLTVAILSPQPVAVTHVADVRFLSSLIFVCIGLSALLIVSLARHNWLIAALLAIPLLGTNTLNHPLMPGVWRSQPVEFVKELWTARKTSISVAADWIKNNVRPGESIWVNPDYMVAPLMYYAPDAVYAWQLKYPPQEQFASLPPIHFLGLIPADYIIYFSRNKVKNELLIILKKKETVRYHLVRVLDVFWDDMSRPEIFWRTFRPIDDFDRTSEAVYVYKLTTPKGVN